MKSEGDALQDLSNSISTEDTADEHETSIEMNKNETVKKGKKGKRKLKNAKTSSTPEKLESSMDSADDSVEMNPETVTKENTEKATDVVNDKKKSPNKESPAKDSMVTSVCQKGGILRSVPLSNHPILMKDLKGDKSADTSIEQRFVCPYCSSTSDVLDVIREHLAQAHKGKDPTVIDRLCYLRKQRCKTFCCWNPECTFRTAVCEEREAHIESGSCKEAYERLYGEPVPKVKEKKAPINKKFVKKVSQRESVLKKDPPPVQNKNYGVIDKVKSEKLKLRVLELFDKKRSQSLERREILRGLKSCSEEELSQILQIMAEDSEVVCSGSIVFIV